MATLAADNTANIDTSEGTEEAAPFVFSEAADVTFPELCADEADDFAGVALAGVEPEVGCGEPDEPELDEELEPGAITILATADGAPVDPWAFWYGVSWPSNCATETVFHPFWIASGMVSMKPETVSFVSSCSRMIKPGDLGPMWNEIKEKGLIEHFFYPKFEMGVRTRVPLAKVWLDGSESKIRRGHRPVLGTAKSK
jgi:hypothetical protein